MNAIRVKNLKKYYQVHKKEPGLVGSIKSLVRRRHKEVKAVDGVSFQISKGELVGFIGPNGAGKTTTLKCLSGLLYPSGGQVSVLGYIPWERKQAFQKQLSLVMGQKNQLFWDLPPLETFILNREIYGVPRRQFDKNLEELVDLLEIKEILNIQVRRLSLGQRMKCELAAALLYRPQVLFLDEPTIGLDVVMQKKLRDFIKKYNRLHSSTIILTSHYMGDIKELCSRVIVIGKGRIAFDGQLEKITKDFADYKVISLVLEKEVDRQDLKKFGRIKEFNFPRAVIMVKRKDVALAAARLLKNLPTIDVVIEEPPIEEVIRKMFKKNFV